MSQPFPAPTRTLYSELLERLLADSARRTIGKAPGTFTTKELSGETYCYFQYSEPGGRVRQLYLGKKSDAIESLSARFKDARREERRNEAELERLCSQILIGGAWSMGAGPARVLRAFADSGLFEAGVVLVGTHAFGVLGNLLGVRWTGAHLRTEDVDPAAIALAAVSREGRVYLPKALDRLAMGFLPVPALDSRGPSTSFKVRGGALRVDMLTPGREGPARALPTLGTSAQPLPFLDFLIERPERAAVLDSGGFLVLVPPPARFALHKLIVAGERAVTEQAKAAKDLDQASALIAFLAESRPGDIRLAADELRRRRWTGRAGRGWRTALRAHPELAPAARLLAL